MIDDQFVRSYTFADHKGTMVAFYGVKINDNGTREAIISDVPPVRHVPVDDIAVYSRKKTEEENNGI